jgi:hypothetical protein
VDGRGRARVLFPVQGVPAQRLGPLLLELAGQGLSASLHPHPGRCAPDASENHRHCRNALHLQRLVLQVNFFTLDTIAVVVGKSESNLHNET